MSGQHFVFLPSLISWPHSRTTIFTLHQQNRHRVTETGWDTMQTVTNTQKTIQLQWIHLPPQLQQPYAVHLWLMGDLSYWSNGLELGERTNLNEPRTDQCNHLDWALVRSLWVLESVVILRKSSVVRVLVLWSTSCQFFILPSSSFLFVFWSKF